MNTFDKKREPGHPCWFDLMTPDVAAVTQFYTELFGWDYDVMPPDMGSYHMAKTQGRSAAGIGSPPPGSDAPSAWTVYYATNDADKSAETATELGGAIISPAFDVTGQGRMAILQDPTGAIFGVWQADAHIGAEIADTHGAMTWCEVNTPDADTAATFYDGLLGSKHQPLAGVPTTYYSLNKGDVTIGGVLQMNEQWEGVPPHWMPYFHVRDTDTAAKLATKHGGSVGVPPFDSPFGRIAVLNDPAGAAFSVIQPPA